MRFWILLVWFCLVGDAVLHAQVQDVTALSQQAAAFESAHDYSNAEQAWQQVVQIAPDNADANAHLGLVESLQGKYKQAIPAYEKALKLHPAYPGLEMNLALAYFKAGELNGAIAPLKEAAKEAPSDMRPQILLGMSYYGTGKYAEAVPYLRASVEQSPTNLQLRLTLAQSCLWATDYPCALEEYRAILQQDPNSAQADMIAGEALDGTGDVIGAIAQFEAAEKAAPSMPNVHFGLGYLLWKQGHFDTAKTEFQKELAINPKNGEAATYLGDIEMKDNEDVSARSHLELAKQQPAVDKLTFLDLGILDARAGKNPEAKAEFEHVIAIAPKEPDAHWRLARLLQAMGRKDEAAKELETVRQLHVDKDQQPLQQITRPQTPTQP